MVKRNYDISASVIITVAVSVASGAVVSGRTASGVAACSATACGATAGGVAKRRHLHWLILLQHM